MFDNILIMGGGRGALQLLPGMYAKDNGEDLRGYCVVHGQSFGA